MKTELIRGRFSGTATAIFVEGVPVVRNSADALAAPANGAACDGITAYENTAVGDTISVLDEGDFHALIDVAHVADTELSPKVGGTRLGAAASGDRVCAILKEASTAANQSRLVQWLGRGSYLKP